MEIETSRKKQSTYLRSVSLSKCLEAVWCLSHEAGKVLLIAKFASFRQTQLVVALILSEAHHSSQFANIRDPDSKAQQDISVTTTGIAARVFLLLVGSNHHYMCYSKAVPLN